LELAAKEAAGSRFKDKADVEALTKHKKEQ
jgi:hypothetical protein